MIRTTFSAFAITLALIAPALSHADVEIGKPAPDFRLKDSAGKEVQLSSLKGKYVVLEWTNHGCPFVKKQYDSGNMQALQKKYTAQGVEWLSVISSAEGKQGFVTPKQAESERKKFKAAPTAILLDTDGKVGKLYGAKTTPDMYVIDAKGTLVYSGAIDDKESTDVADIKDARNYVAAALDESMAGKPVSNSLTKPYGCGVKY